jgi:hypothetical protein
MNAARRLVSLVLVLLCALGSGLALATMSGWAAETHEYLSQFSGVPAVGPHGEAIPLPGPFSLGGSNALTVDSGQVYFAEGALGGQPSRLDKFEVATNAFVSQLPQPPAAADLELLDQGVAVGHSGGEAEVYVGADQLVEGVPRGVVAVFDASGALRTVWTGTKASSTKERFGCFECSGTGDVAVDDTGAGWAAGDVYVADPTNDVVDVFAPETGGGEEPVAKLQGRSPSEPFGHPVGVAVTETGEVLVADQHEDNTTEIDIFRPGAIAGQYEFVSKLTLPSGLSLGVVTGLAASDGTGGIYVVGYAVEGQSSTPRVFEFDAAGEFEGFINPASLPGGSFGAGLEHPEGVSPYGVATDPVTHRVYVSTAYDGERPDPVFVFGPTLVLPDVTTTAASSVQPTSATLSGTVDLAKAGPANCQIDWGTTPAFGHVAPCTAKVEAEGQVPVSVTLAGLEPDTTYYYRLEATNANGINEGEARQDLQFKTPGPGLRGEWASEASSTSVTFGATIDPDGAPTSYYFQYGKSSEYEAEAPLAPGSQIGSGETVTVSQHVQGLSVGAVYHYRVVVLSELEVKPGVFERVAFPGPDQQVTTQGAGSALVLPDDRQWELVSPREKRGGLIAGLPVPLIQASAAGNAIMYDSSAPPEGPVEGYDLKSQLLSIRGPGGWSTQNVSLRHTRATGINSHDYSLVSEDLSLGLIAPSEFENEPVSLAGEAAPPATETTPFLRHNATCQSEPASCFEPLLTEAPGFSDTPPGASDFGQNAQIAGATPSLSRVVLAVNAHGLYEWFAGAPASQAVRPVSVLPAGEGGKQTSGQLERFEAGRHAISEDGSRVVWTARAGGLYLRDMSAGEGETVRLDAVQGGSGNGQALPHFQAASGDGSTVFFTDAQRLTKDAAGEHELYACELVETAGTLTCDLKDLTPGKVEVLGDVLGASDDGSSVYFVATGALASEENERHEKPVPGAPNLYVLHRDGASGQWEAPRLVAVLSGDDAPDWAAEGPARVSSNGRYLTFMSDRSLTGYDNRDASSGAPDEEVFLYDAAAGRLVCPSCDPTGARPEGIEYGAKVTIGTPRLTQEPDWPSSSWVASQTPMWAASGAHQPRSLSDAGRLFFDSNDALVPQDINHNQDVYEYEPAGVGSCSPSTPTFAAASGGCVGLITSGTASAESAFVDASENGEDVFFLTEKLVREDPDTALDVYDAHECTSAAPCASVPVPPPACTTADACRAAPLLEPAIFGAPASATFSGAGNIASSGSGAARPKRLTRAQKLAAALRECRAKKHKRRAACERRTRKRYAASAPRKVKAKRKGNR